MPAQAAAERRRGEHACRYMYSFLTIPRKFRGSDQQRASPFRVTALYVLHLAFNNAVNRELKQEAQLSQRDRATLRVTEYFAKLLKVTQGHSKWALSKASVSLY